MLNKFETTFMLSTREYILTEEVSFKKNDTDTFMCSRGA